jgi:hypothetical protein
MTSTGRASNQYLAASGRADNDWHRPLSVRVCAQKGDHRLKVWLPHPLKEHQNSGNFRSTHSCRIFSNPIPWTNHITG